MLKFKQYILEQRVKYTDAAHLLASIKQYMKAGEILNPEYNEMKQQASDLYHKSFRAHEQKFQDTSGRIQDEDFWELRFALAGWNLSDVAKAEKMLAKVEKKKLPGIEQELKIAKQFVSEWKPVLEGIKALKDKVVKVSTKRAQAKATAATAMEKKFRDSSTLIKLLESHLDEYKEMARKRAEEFVKDKMDELKKHGWDLNLAAPVPKMRDGQEAYQIAAQKQSIMSMLTSPTKPVIIPGEPRIRKPNPAAAAKYISDAVKESEASYRAFMQKMIEKIGKPVVKAKMTGNIWTDATINVTTDDGETQVWSTRMILNFSKYQRMFNQFPSRRKK